MINQVLSAICKIYVELLQLVIISAIFIAIFDFLLFVNSTETVFLSF